MPFDLYARVCRPEDVDALSGVIRGVLHRFSAIQTDLGLCEVDPFQIVLKSGTRPIKQRAYCRNPVISAQVQVEIDKMLAAGILRKSCSAWALLIVAVVKKDKSIRITVKYKCLHGCTAVPVLPVPLLEDLLDNMSGAVVLSCLDLSQGFHEIKIHANSIPLTAVCTQDALYV